MAPDPQLWGTVSVLDHKRPYAFVAELGLFDVLVVPVPTEKAREEWSAERWDAESQQQLLKLIPDERLRRVPWDQSRHGAWKSRMVASQVAADVVEIQEDRQHFAQAGRTVADYNAEQYHRTRRVLQDFIHGERDRELVPGMPNVPVTVIPAYDGPDAFLKEAGEAEPPAGEPRQERLLRAFQWEFLAPASEDRYGAQRPHEDLIRAALELEKLPEVREHRQAFRSWTGLQALKGRDPAAMRAEMEDLLSRYAKAVKASGIPVMARRACGLAELGSAAAAVVAPWFGLVGPLMKFFGVEKRLDTAGRLPDDVRPAALLHAMRQSFAQVKAPGLRLDDPVPLPIQRFWPGTAGLSLP